MQYNQNKKVVDTVVSFFSFPVSLIITLSLLFFSQSSHSQAADSIATMFILKGNTQLTTGKSITGVSLELKRNGATISKFLSGKNGKFLIEMDISISNINNEYTLYVSKEGMVPKTLNVNTYIPKNEFLTHDYEQYDFFLEIVMYEQPKNENVVTKHSGTIQWSSNENKFILDEVFSKIAPKEQDNLSLNNTNPVNTETTVTTTTPTIEPATTTTIVAEKNEIPDNTKSAPIEEPITTAKKDSFSKQVEVSADKATIQIKKNSKINPKAVDLGAFDGTAVYSINIERNVLNNKRKRDRNEQAKNSSTKYETENILTSMLDVVDEQTKLNKTK